MDLNTGLPQALSDGTNDYLYAYGRVAQTSAPGTREYFLADALGSVRQLVDSTGALTLSKTHDPYGAPTTVGTSASSYGFTGEYQSGDSVYLRSRFYAPSTGRFLTRDTWGGDAMRPMSYNKWGYVYGNPVNLLDPSGHFPEECMIDGDFSVDCLREFYVHNHGVDLSMLDYNQSGIGVSGFDLYVAYKRMLAPEYENAWYCASDRFDIWDFVSIILIKEGGGNHITSKGYFPKYTEAIGRAFYNWCNASSSKCKDGEDAASVLNWLASYSASAKGVHLNPGEPATTDKWNIYAMKPGIDALQGGQYTGGCVANLPCHWGDLANMNALPQAWFYEKAEAAKSAPWFVVWDNPFFIISYCQMGYWHRQYIAENGETKYFWEQGGKSAWNRQQADYEKRGLGRCPNFGG